MFILTLQYEPVVQESLCRSLRRELVFILTLQYELVVQESLCRFKEGVSLYTYSPV